MLRSSLRYLVYLSLLTMGGLACLPVRPPFPESPSVKSKDVIATAGQNDTSVVSSKLASATQVSALAASSNAFAFDLYEQLRANDDNLFFSPYSVSTALAMTSAGARGKTLDEMKRVLHFPDQAELHPAESTLSSDMLRRAGKQVELTTANALWLQKGRPVRDDFLSLMRTHYRAGCQQVDFIGNTESARLTINRWTEKQTRRHIRDLLPHGVLSRDTRLVLTNAIYFKAKWEKEFEKSQTRNEDFHLLNGRTLKKPMMHQTDTFAYTETDGLQVLEMPYSGNDFSLVILLPRNKANLADVEGKMSKSLNHWLESLSQQKVIVTVPRFEMTRAMSLKNTLSRMGMSRAFTGAAEFDGIDNGQSQLCIGDVIHKAFVEVSEKGTEAAAATAVELMLWSSPGMSPQRPVEFTANRPFVYLIRDRGTGAILFLGRYVGKEKA